MKHTHNPHHNSRFVAPAVLVGLCALYILYVPPQTQLMRFGFVLLSTIALSSFLWNLQHRLIIVGITIGMYELMTITLGFDILNTIVLVSTGLVIYLYATLEQSARNR